MRYPILTKDWFHPHSLFCITGVTTRFSAAFTHSFCPELLRSSDVYVCKVVGSVSFDNASSIASQLSSYWVSECYEVSFRWYSLSFQIGIGQFVVRCQVGCGHVQGSGRIR